MTFSQLGLNPNILKAIEEQGYDTPTPIQEQSIPTILEHHDVLAAAQTGTGKTAGFTLPLLEIMSKKPKAKDKKASIKALILTPTRELAIQVGENIENYSKYLNLKTTIVYGGVGINPQKAAFRKGVDIVVATPGRLIDHIGQKTIDLSHVDFLVLDEADRMLDMGFIHDIKRIMSQIPKHRQTLLFSATFSKEIKKLSESILNNPKSIEVSRTNSLNEQVSQEVLYVNKEKKKNLLSFLIHTKNWEQVLVFTRTKHGSNRLCEFLNKCNIPSLAIHGGKSQGARNKALNEFKAKNIKVLVATDIAARGLDIELLPYVVNYELPNIPEDYVHRIGRTGRAGNIGLAISLVCDEEAQYLEDIEKLTNTNIEVKEVEGFTQSSLKSINTNKKIKASKTKKQQEQKSEKKIGEKKKRSKPNSKSRNKDKPRELFDFQKEIDKYMDEKKKNSSSNRTRRVTSDSRPRGSRRK